MKKRMRMAILILLCAAAAGAQEKPKTMAFPEPLALQYRESLVEAEKLQAIKAAIEARISTEQERQQRIIYQAALQLGLTQQQIEKISIVLEGGPKFVLSAEGKKDGKDR